MPASPVAAALQPMVMLVAISSLASIFQSKRQSAHHRYLQWVAKDAGNPETQTGIYMQKGSKIQVDWDFGTVRGIGTDSIYVELDHPKITKRRTVRYMFARQKTVVGGIASVTYWIKKQMKKEKPWIKIP